MTEYYTERDIVDFAENWRSANGFAEGETLADEQIAKFVGELQERVALMDYSIPKGSTIIGYSGNSNGEQVWKIVQQAAHAEGSAGFYISDLPAGKLLNDPVRTELKDAIAEITNDSDIAGRIMSGWYGPEARSAWSGFGEFVSLDDFVSAKLMGGRVLGFLRILWCFRLRRLLRIGFLRVRRRRNCLRTVRAGILTGLIKSF
ncbi:MAG: hypothetical protein IIY20_05690 [Bifidobacteriaceae bacterium]|nr:hypothetical protein [Bifidobacteriaceae bacterium]